MCPAGYRASLCADDAGETAGGVGPVIPACRDLLAEVHDPKATIRRKLIRPIPSDWLRSIRRSKASSQSRYTLYLNALSLRWLRGTGVSQLNSDARSMR
jgi:hypothetical protein